MRSFDLTIPPAADQVCQSEPSEKEAPTRGWRCGKLLERNGAEPAGANEGQQSYTDARQRPTPRLRNSWRDGRNGIGRCYGRGNDSALSDARRNTPCRRGGNVAADRFKTLKYPTAQIRQIVL